MILVMAMVMMVMRGVTDDNAMVVVVMVMVFVMVMMKIMMKLVMILEVAFISVDADGNDDG